MLRRFAMFYRLKINVSKLCHALVSEGDSSWTLSNDRTERENRRQLDRPADSSYATGNKVFLLSTRGFVDASFSTGHAFHLQSIDVNSCRLLIDLVLVVFLWEI